jgi:hypothetical protein
VAEARRSRDHCLCGSQTDLIPDLPQVPLLFGAQPAAVEVMSGFLQARLKRRHLGAAVERMRAPGAEVTSLRGTEQRWRLSGNRWKTL